MKKRLRALLAAALSLCMLLSSCGMGGSPLPQPPYDLPDWLAQKQEASSALGEGSGTLDKKEIQVDFFYDNTQSMDGYVRGQDLSYGDPDGLLVRTLTALRNINREYSATMYTMQPENGILHWAEYQGRLYDDFSKKEFYTYSGNYYNKQGPLRSLFFGEGVVNPKNINVFVTDLCEQGVDNAELAHQINENILTQEGYAAAIIAMKAHFNGKPSYPDPEKVNSMSDPNQVVHQPRPYYIILTGPYSYLSRYLSDFEENMKEVKKGEDYYLSVYRPGSGVEPVSFGDIRTVRDADYIEEMDESTLDDVNLPVNLNLSVQRIGNTQIPQLFKTDDYLNVLGFNYLDSRQAVNLNKTQRMVLNFFLPVTTEDGNLDGVSFTVGDRYTPTGNAEVDKLLSKRECLTFSYLSPLTDEEINSYWERLPGGSQSSGEEELPSYRWETVSSQLEQDTQITVTWDKQLVRAGDVLQFEESPLLPPGYQPAPLFSGSDYDEDFTPDTMGIHIRVRAASPTSAMAGSTVVFNLPVYAVNLSDRDMDPPEWVGEFDSGDTRDHVGRTYNLDIFYKTLFGLTNRDDPELMRAQRETKIADLTVAVTDLPVESAQ